MPKVKETANAFVISPTFMESLSEALSAILPQMLKNVQATQQEKAARRKTELDLSEQQRQAQAQFQALDPHTQQEIQRVNPKYVADIYDPNFSRRSTLSTATKLGRKEKAELESLSRQEVTPGSIRIREHSPEELAKEQQETFKAQTEKVKAEREAFQFTGEKDLQGVLAGYHSGKNSITELIGASIKATGKVPSTEELMSLGAPQSQINIKTSAEPGSPMWAKQQASEVVKDVLKDHPDVDPKDAFAYAMRAFDPQAPSVKLKPGLSERKQVLDEKINDRMWAAQNLDAKKFKLEEAKLHTELTQKFVDNLPSAQKPKAAEYAQSWLRTGKMPPGALFPMDAKRALDAEKEQYEIEQAKLDIAKAKVENPEFSRMLQIAEKYPVDSSERAQWMKKVETKFYELYPYKGEAPKGFFGRAYERHKAFWGPIIQAHETMGKVVTEGARGVTEEAIAGSPLATAITQSGVGGKLKDAAVGAAAPLDNAITSAIGGGKVTPEQERMIQAQSQSWLDIVQSPQVPEAIKEEVRRRAAQLKQAQAAGDIAAIMRILSGKE